MAQIAVNNYELYKISKPDKNGCPTFDLSHDDEAEPSSPFKLSDPDVRLARVLTKAVAVASHFQPIMNNRLLAIVRSKLWRMGKALSKKNAAQRRLIFDRWKISNWNIELESTEVRSAIIEENTRLAFQLEKKTSEVEKLKEENSGIKKTLDEAKDENSSLHMELTCVKTKNEQLQHKLGVETGTRTPLQPLNNTVITTRKRKSWDEYSDRHKKRKVQELRDKVMDIKDDQFEVTAIHVRNRDTGSSERIPADAGVPETPEVQFQSDDHAKKVLLVKDRFGISNEAYHELSMLDKHLPRSCKISKETKQINDQWEINPVPGDCTGAQQSLKQRLSERILNLMKSVDENSPIKRSHKVRVKLTGDGTYIGSRQHIVTFGFTLLDEGAAARSPNGNYTVCIFRAPESYESMSVCLRDVVKDVQMISDNGIEVDGERFEVDFYLGADWKFLATVCGIESPNCTHACIWCTCPKNQRYNGEKEWSITDVSKGARTIESISEGSKLSAKSKKKFNCARIPLFPMIPISRVVIDNLHLFLRIVDNLVNLLIIDLRRLDGVEKCVNLSSSEAANLKKYETFLLNTCKINFHFYTCKDTSSLKWRDLTGPEKYVLLNRIDLPNLFPNLPNAVLIQKVWKEFATLNESIRSESMSASEIRMFASKAKLWLELFIQVYQTKHVTPYMHALVAHLPEFLTLYGSIIPFTQQGLERLNDQYTHFYFRGTNHHDYVALKQLLLKKNRIEVLTDEGYVRPKKKQVHACSSCGIPGHNKITCPTEDSS